MEWVPVAHAVTAVVFGPLAPYRMEIWPLAMLAIIIGMKKGLTRRGPRSSRMLYCSSQLPRPPMPEPTMTPVRSGSAFSPMRMPASRRAIPPAATPNWTNRSMRRASFLSMWFSGCQSLISAAIRVGYSDVSNDSIRLTPDFPSSKFFQNVSRSVPRDETTPIPVTTMRRFKTKITSGLQKRSPRGKVRPAKNAAECGEVPSRERDPGRKITSEILCIEPLLPRS